MELDLQRGGEQRGEGTVLASDDKVYYKSYLEHADAPQTPDATGELKDG